MLGSCPVEPRRALRLDRDTLGDKNVDLILRNNIQVVVGRPDSRVLYVCGWLRRQVQTNGCRDAVLIDSAGQLGAVVFLQL